MRRTNWRLFLCAVASTASVLLGVSVRDTGASGPAGDWPTYLHDTNRTAQNGNETVLSTVTARRLIKLWSFATNGFIAPSATIVGDISYIGSWDGNFYAINAVTGAQKWSRFLGQTTTNCFSPVGISSSATVANGTVYVGGGDAQLYALNATTGAVLWHISTGDNSVSGGHYLFSSPLIHNGYAYIGVASFCDNPLVQGQLLQVSLSTHSIVHTFNVVPAGQVGGGVWTSPSVDPITNTIFITTGNEGDPSQQYARSIIALDADQLTVKSWWQSPASSTVPDLDWGTTPLIFDQRVTATNKDGSVYAFNRTNLAAGPLWQRNVARAGPDPEAGDASASSAAYGGGRLYVAGGATTINGISYAGSVRALDPATGNVIWEKGTPGIVLPALAYANGVVFDDEDATFEARNAATGSVLYSYTTGGTMWGAPSISNGRVFAGSNDGSLYAFSLDPATDGDGDGCPDARELGPDWRQGGQRDPGNSWDFADVPAPVSADPAPTGPRDKVISLKDVIATLFYVGTQVGDAGHPNANGVTYDSTKDGDWFDAGAGVMGQDGTIGPDDALGRRYDRSPSTDPNRGWQSGPPNGVVSLADALVVLPSLGTSCT